jgi:hypothetical protein
VRADPVADDDEDTALAFIKHDFAFSRRDASEVCI